MAECLSDYSKIAELQEIRKLHDEQHERHRSELAERDRIIAELRDDLARMSPAPTPSDETDQLARENERLTRQLQVLRTEYDAKLERLNERLRELSAAGTRAAQPENERKGFFRR